MALRPQERRRAPRLQRDPNSCKVFLVRRDEAKRKAQSLQINWSVFDEDFLIACCLVVESDICAALLHELDLLLRAGGGDDFQALPLR